MTVMAAVDSGSVWQQLLANRDRQFWLLHCAGWCGWIMIFLLRDWQSMNSRLLLVLFIDAFAGMLLTLPLRYIYRRVWHRPLVDRILAVLVSSFLVALVWQPLKNFVRISLDPEVASEQFGIFTGLVEYGYYLIICWSCLYFGIKFYQLLQEERVRNIRAKAMIHAAELRALRYQLNPHFLFNTLNALSTLILSDQNETAEQVVGRFSRVLRYSLDHDPMFKVPLEKELDMLTQYLQIEKVRFDERLRYSLEIDDEALRGLVPSMMLQPLVESAIRQAVVDSDDGATITVQASVFAGELLIHVADDGTAERQGEEGAEGASAMLSDRLRDIYGTAYMYRVEKGPHRGFAVRIGIPFETAQGQT